MIDSLKYDSGGSKDMSIFLLSVLFANFNQGSFILEVNINLIL